MEVWEIWLSFVGPILVAALGAAASIWLVRAQKRKLEAEAQATLDKAKADAAAAITTAATEYVQDAREERRSLRERLKRLEELCACYLWVLEKMLTGTSLAQTRRLAREAGIVDRLESLDGGHISDLLQRCESEEVTT